jgi:hypothetical protein
MKEYICVEDFDNLSYKYKKGKRYFAKPYLVSNFTEKNILIGYQIESDKMTHGYVISHFVGDLSFDNFFIELIKYRKLKLNKLK